MVDVDMAHANALVNIGLRPIGTAQGRSLQNAGRS